MICRAPGEARGMMPRPELTIIPELTRRAMRIPVWFWLKTRGFGGLTVQWGESKVLTRLVRSTALIIGLMVGLAGMNAAAYAGLGAGAEPNWEPWVEVGGYASNHADRAELVGWAPLAQDDDELLFIDVRGKLFEGSTEEGNIAVGYRHMRSDGWNFGIWGGFDIRTSENGNSFKQISAGLEGLSADWDFRVNGYYPLEDRENAGSSSAVSAVTTASGPALSLVGSQLFFVRSSDLITTSTTTQGLDLAAWGVDGEIGRRAPLEDWLDWIEPVNDAGDRYDHEVRVFLGAYYFDHSLFPDAIWGPRLRTEWRVNDFIEALPGSRLTLEAEAQYDDVRKEQFEIGLRLRIPLGAPDNFSRSLSAQSARMMEALERDTDIVTRTSAGAGGTSTNVTTVNVSTTLEPVNDPVTNVELNSVVFLTTPGTAQASVTAAGADTLLVFEGDNGDFGAISLAANQSIVGGTEGIIVRGRTTSVQDTYVAPGTAATLRLVAEADVLTMANNTHATGLTIESNNGPPTDGIFVAGGTTNVYIDNNVLQNLGGRGLEADAGTQVTFTNNIVRDIGFDGADIGAGASVVLSNNTWRNISQSVFEAQENVTLTFTGNDLQGTSSAGGGTASIFRFSGAAAPVIIVDGSGNTNNLVNTPTLCVTAGVATFTGTITLGGTLLTDNVLPCN